MHEKLLQQWREFKWNEAELEWIVSRILIKDTILDPSEFITHPIAYVDHHSPLKKKNFFFRKLV